MQNKNVLLKRVTLENKAGLLEDGFVVDFSLNVLENLENVHWKITYVVDMANTKQSVVLGQSEVMNYSPSEETTFKYQIDRINLDGVSPMLLNNVAVIVVALVDQKDEELFKCSMVVQAERNEQDGKIYRTIFNPTE
ncbi:hypothetical protein NAEGRDRAFT_81223 [Naegleria gruberi]|uniref:Uncharacterized protein n=1 Tax=Naegleria gruberi TaxID=5762 RepID=D2VU06_NAEGR|nr:uncharacterized protein NAEGRDRAFT_81223 [Naegleria gruberi]EFC39813.1 hypothetical protein NAEGRDRAFT_81223 [Naegleria gruberi]|eukprot:XP_002672557.1 hypothetical protein NAEGRDRAFT_81223 [Naegleria gruberi strain NEG-M]